MSASSGGGQTTAQGAVCEGFTLQSRTVGDEKGVAAAAREVLGTNFELKPFGDEKTDYEVRITPGDISKEEAWEKTYQLRARADIEYAEPMFLMPAVSAPPKEGARADAPDATRVAGAGDVRGRDATERSAFRDDKPLEKSKELDWNIRQIQADAAWEEFTRQHPGRLPGDGILIAHPDTGYSKHPEISDSLQLDKAWNFVLNNDSALDALERGRLLFPGHGTSTASVIVSPQESPAGYKGGNVKGVAPGAKLIPLRVSNTVIHFSTANVANAIEYAADVGAHVVSMSLGGLFSFRLRKAVLYAQRRGVILVAAAGNEVRYVIWPAAYEEVIAVAASNADLQPWAGSSRGSAVDVTAPGESVWVAAVGDKDDDFIVRQSSGTSFATAAVAGTAALWLSYHGRDKLINRYGAENLSAVFKQVLRRTSSPADWAKNGYGIGIINAWKALTAKLPEGVERSTPSRADEHPPLDSGQPQTFAHLFEQSIPGGFSSYGLNPQAEAELRTKLAGLLNTTEAQLPALLEQVGQEVAFNLAFDPDLYKMFSAAFSKGVAERTAGARGAGSGAEVEAVRERMKWKGVSDTLRRRIGES